MFESLHEWISRTLQVDVYEVRGDQIVASGLPRRRIRISDIQTWQGFYVGGGVASICVEFSDGRRIDYSDRHEQLFQILHKAAADRECPFTTA